MHTHKTPTYTSSFLIKTSLPNAEAARTPVRPRAVLRQFAMNSIAEKLRSRQVPVWTRAELLERTRGWSETYLASGCYGSTNLLSNDS